MGERELKKEATKGVIWTALQKYSVMLATFVSDIVLARLLLPSDFGCVEMLVIFILLAETIVNGGFGAALIQKKRPTQDDYSTIFIWNFLVAIIIYVVLYFSAPAIARFYGINSLSQILRVQGLILFIYVFNIIQYSILKKQLRFKAISIVTVIGSFISLVVAIVMAYVGCGVWALVARNLVMAGVTALIFWFYVKWRPSWYFSWKSFRELFSFGFYIFLSNLVTSFSAKIQSLLIGRVFNANVMGYFSKASGTENQASTSISQIMAQITYPLYAEVQDDLVALGNMVKRISTTLAYLSFPMMFVLMLVAKPLFVLLYSSKWLPSVPYFQVLCFAGLGTCLQSVNFYTISAIGKSKITFKWTMIKRIIGIGLIVGGLALWGMKGILLGTVLNAWFAYFVNMGLVSKHVLYKWYKQLADIAPVLTASVICAVISYVSVNYFKLDLYVDGALKLVLYIFLYMGWSFIFKPEAFVYTQGIVKPIIVKLKSKIKYRSIY